MKNYTREERKEARSKLSKPLNDFLSSDELLKIYTGLFKKHKLNFNQSGLMSEVVNTTLIGLESEKVLETNIHQVLPELSNATTLELVADINDRVFKEARRRIQENIVVPEPVWDEEELGKKPSPDDPPLLSDAELDTLAEKEAVEGWKSPEESLEDEEKRLAALAPITPEDTADMPASSIVAERLGLVTDVPSENKKDETGATTLETPEGKTTEVSTESAPTETTNPTPTKPQVSEPVKPAYKGGVDPYREPVE